MDWTKWTPQTVGASITGIIVVLAIGYFTLQGIPVPPWLNTLFDILIGTGIYGLGHQVGTNSALNAANGALTAQQSAIDAAVRTAVQQINIASDNATLQQKLQEKQP